MHNPFVVRRLLDVVGVVGVVLLVGLRAFFSVLEVQAVAVLAMGHQAR